MYRGSNWGREKPDGVCSAIREAYHDFDLRKISFQELRSTLAKIDKTRAELEWSNESYRSQPSEGYCDWRIDYDIGPSFTNLYDRLYRETCVQYASDVLRRGLEKDPGNTELHAAYEFAEKNAREYREAVKEQKKRRLENTRDKCRFKVKRLEAQVIENKKAIVAAYEAISAAKDNITRSEAQIEETLAELQEVEDQLLDL
jgi:hypothetical protein